MKIKPSRLASCCLLGCIAVIGCQVPQKAPALNATATLACKVPVLTPLPETRQSQEKGGIEISVAPASYKAALETIVKQRRVEPNLAESLQMLSIPEAQRANYIVVEETRRSSLKPSPDRLAFLIKINNKLPRVFRGAGTVVQFNVSGKLLAVDQGGYAEMVQSIVPPRTEQQLIINGPALDLLGDSGTVGLFLYDVVTAIDNAGSVTEKQNYEWYFNYSTKVDERRVEVHSPQHKFVTIQEFRPEIREQ